MLPAVWCQNVRLSEQRVDGTSQCLGLAVAEMHPVLSAMLHCLPFVACCMLQSQFPNFAVAFVKAFAYSARAAHTHGLVQGLCEPAACGGRGDRDPKTPNHAYAWDSKLCQHRGKLPKYKHHSSDPVNKQTMCQFYHNRQQDDNGDDVCVPCGFPGHKCDNECEFTLQWNTDGAPRHNMGTYWPRFDLRVHPCSLCFALAAAPDLILQVLCVNRRQLHALQGLLQHSTMYTLCHCRAAWWPSCKRLYLIRLQRWS